MRKTPLFIGVLVAGAAAFYATYFYEYGDGEARQRAFREELRSGQHDFGEQPALFAVAQAIVKNDAEAIRTAAATLPDLQAPGRDGMTLLVFAIRSSWQRPELVTAVQTLISLGADPNHRNGGENSLAMAHAVHGSAALLRVMLDAGGDPNARDEHGPPIILMNGYLGYYPQDRRARLDLLLDRGADINSTMPESDSDEPGYTLLLHRMAAAPADDAAYADALHLLKRGADPNHVAGDEMTFAKLLKHHREQFWQTKTPPADFQALWDAAQANGLLN